MVLLMIVLVKTIISIMLNHQIQIQEIMQLKDGKLTIYGLEKPMIEQLGEIF